MRKTYYTPSLSVTAVCMQDVLAASGMSVDMTGDFKDHLQEWGF